jgi:hypothetical protein
MKRGNFLARGTNNFSGRILLSAIGTGVEFAAVSIT